MARYTAKAIEVSYPIPGERERERREREREREGEGGKEREREEQMGGRGESASLMFSCLAQALQGSYTIPREEER